MNTITTLSGGLVAVFALYVMGGAIRNLPPMLRALLAGLLPLLVYFGLIVGRWPGLDVVAIHISVFLAAGFVLYAVTQIRRRSVGRMHWAPKLLTAFFMGLVVINGTLLYIATKGLPDPIGRWWLGSDGRAVYSGFSGVVPHGEGAAKAVSSELSRAYRESELGWHVGVPGWQFYATTIITLAAGTAFLMWLGEMISERGIGNGISLIIFAGIVTRIPVGFRDAWAIKDQFAGLFGFLILVAFIGLLSSRLGA